MYSTFAYQGSAPINSGLALASGELALARGNTALPRKQHSTGAHGKPDKISATDQHASHALIELHNYPHLCAVYGKHFAAQTSSALWRCVRALCGNGSALSDNRFLLELPVEMPAGTVSSLIESWQLSLGTSVLPCGANQILPVVTVSPVAGADGVPLHVAPAMPAVRGGLSWTLGYERDMRIALGLYRALAQGDVRLTFQPVLRREGLAVARGGDAVLYHKARLCVRDERGDFAASASTESSNLISALERLWLVRAMDRAVLETVVTCLETRPAVRLGCDISALSLVDDAWWERLLMRMSSQPSVAARLTLEITGTASPAEGAVDFAKRLRSAGCQIALNNFGVGHNGLSFARILQPQVIILDQSFLRAARASRTASNQLFRLSDLCRTLAPIVVAEGVERIDDMQALALAGIDWLQEIGATRHDAGKRVADLVLQLETGASGIHARDCTCAMAAEAATSARDEQSSASPMS